MVSHEVDPSLQLAEAALRKAESILEEEEEEGRGAWQDACCGGRGGVSVVCFQREALRLLSPPNRAVPEAMWACLREEEEMYLELRNCSEVVVETDEEDERLDEGGKQEEEGGEEDGQGGEDSGLRHGCKRRRDADCDHGERRGDNDELEAGTVQTSYVQEKDAGEGEKLEEEYADEAFEATVEPAVSEQDPYLILVKKDEEGMKRNWCDGVRKRFRARFPAKIDRVVGTHIVYVCGVARRLADNAALQHSMWLAKHLCLPLVVIALFEQTLVVSTKDVRLPARTLAALGALSEIRARLAQVPYIFELPVRASSLPSPSPRTPLPSAPASPKPSSSPHPTLLPPPTLTPAPPLLTPDRRPPPHHLLSLGYRRPARLGHCSQGPRSSNGLLRRF